MKTLKVHNNTLGYKKLSSYWCVAIFKTYAEVFYPLFIKRVSLNKKAIDYLSICGQKNPVFDNRIVRRNEHQKCYFAMI